ncbi:UNVERIFIED_CONTAM: putative ferric reduction oxidase 1 [Sesamum latifolium]|uniref:ferric-chelate reductase (NADH) n=1 Tax=Sesamum latifolium TaxID=2727402 RepID=A0AAW2U459_9LAMI
MASPVIITAVRTAILLLALLVFLGYIMMWIMMPTDTYYNHWLLHILADTNSTFFGIQGPIMLDFTFPILFIAVLGCIYLHMGKRKSSITESKRDTKLRFLKRPMIVKGLGIITVTELALFTMFIALCVWYFSDYLRHWFKQVPVLSTTRGEKEWESKVERVGLVAGVAGNLCLTFLFYPVSRGSSILPMLGLTSEGSIKHHIWLGNIGMALFTVHGLLYFVYWGFTNRLSELLKWDDHYVSNVAGEISLLCGLALWVTTYPTIRRKMFELFLYTHYLYILFIIFFILHTGIGFACIMLPALYLFVIDRYLRFLQSRAKVRLLSALVLQCQTVELNFSKTRGLSYNPTSTIFINVPSISKLQWHPFTITSNSNLEPETLSVIIKCEGSWTRKLYDVISSPSPIDHLQVSVEGPYGPATTNFLRHDMLVMISGGSGITPFISIIRELIFIRSTLKCKTPKIKLISVFKNFSNLSMLDLILPASSYSSNSSNLDLQIEAYVTREKGNSKGKFEPSRTICFKPNASDEPISPALGPIVGSGLLVARFCGTRSRVPKKLSNFKHTEESTTIKSSEDIELESLPLESVTKSINVHYGHRPNLKRILMEIKESNVGTLVSGPKRYEGGCCSHMLKWAGR